MKMGVGVVGLCCLTLLVLVDVAEMITPLPGFNHAPSATFVYTEKGALCVETIPSESNEAFRRDLIEQGRHIVVVGEEPVLPNSVSSMGGYFIPLCFFEVLFGAIVGWCLVRPRWRGWLRYKRGLCGTCGYVLFGCPSEQCPECGTKIRPLPETLRPPRPPSRRGKVALFSLALLPLIGPCAIFCPLGAGLHSDGFGPNVNLRDPPNPNPDIYFLVRYGDVIGFRKDGGLVLFLLTDQYLSEDGNDNRCKYKACYWVREADSLTIQPDAVSGGSMFRQAGKKISAAMNIGSWAVTWGGGSMEKYWIYTYDPSFKIVENLDWSRSRFESVWNQKRSEDGGSTE